MVTSERGEVRCNCDTHCGKQILNTVYSMSVEHVFTSLFSRSEFYSEFQRSRKTTDIVVNQCWQKTSITGEKTRQITYNVDLGSGWGPSVAPTSEYQTMLNRSEPGSLYVIDVDVFNKDIPYCDTFYTNLRYCLTRVSDKQCRIRVHGQIKYKKYSWMFENFIEHKVMQGIEDCVRELEMALQRECVKFKRLDEEKTRQQQQKQLEQQKIQQQQQKQLEEQLEQQKIQQRQQNQLKQQKIRQQQQTNNLELSKRATDAESTKIIITIIVIIIIIIITINIFAKFDLGAMDFLISSIGSVLIYN